MNNVFRWILFIPGGLLAMRVAEFIATPISDAACFLWDIISYGLYLMDKFMPIFTFFSPYDFSDVEGAFVLNRQAAKCLEAFCAAGSFTWASWLIMPNHEKLGKIVMGIVVFLFICVLLWVLIKENGLFFPFLTAIVTCFFCYLTAINNIQTERK